MHVYAHRSGLADARGHPLAHHHGKVKKSKTKSKNILSRPPPAGHIIVGASKGSKSSSSTGRHRSLLAKGYDASGSSGNGKLSQVCTFQSHTRGMVGWGGSRACHVHMCIGGLIGCMWAPTAACLVFFLVNQSSHPVRAFSSFIWLQPSDYLPPASETNR